MKWADIVGKTRAERLENARLFFIALVYGYSGLVMLSAYLGHLVFSHFILCFLTGEVFILLIAIGRAEVQVRVLDSLDLPCVEYEVVG